MTDGEILKFCDRQYQRYYDAIIMMGNDRERMIMYLDNEKAASGLCLFIGLRLGEKIPCWIKDIRNFYQRNKLYWCTKPFNCQTAQEVVFSIKWRLDRLNALLNQKEVTMQT